jgi:hypothetical protein
MELTLTASSGERYDDSTSFLPFYLIKKRNNEEITCENNWKSRPLGARSKYFLSSPHFLSILPFSELKLRKK